MPRLSAVLLASVVTASACGASALETRTGRASYYSDALAGRSTASGEPYDPGQLTAATRDLPFDTRVRVTRVTRARAWWCASTTEARSATGDASSTSAARPRSACT